ncbi:MAG: SMC-Scp complex subunit ScpB [Clostridia bacterium]|nr:SMC-Scp complex subunit ScpB [Clostridia bacterium]
MRDRELKNTIEAMLFAAGDEITAKRISEALDVDCETTTRLIEELSLEYLAENRGIIIRRLKDTFQMCTNPVHFEKVRILFDRPDSRTLSQAAYETLAVIAYNTEATRAKIESVRGVGCGSSIATLMDRGLIEEAGRLDAPGRPVVYRPSMEFYRAFGLKSLDDLIPLEGDREDGGDEYSKAADEFDLESMDDGIES